MINPARRKRDNEAWITTNYLSIAVYVPLGAYAFWVAYDTIINGSVDTCLNSAGNALGPFVVLWFGWQMLTGTLWFQANTKKRRRKNRIIDIKKQYRR